MEIELKEQIQRWLKKDPEYISGLGLLIQVCKNRTLLRNLSRKETPNNLKKIVWELKKSIGETGLAIKADPSEKKKIEEGPQSYQVGSPSASKTEDSKNITSYPKIIEMIISAVGKLSNERDILHRQLKDVPEANTDQNKLLREGLIEQIKAKSEKLDHYYKLKDLYFTDKVLPTEEDLVFPKPEIKIQKTADKPLQVDGMTEAELLKKRTNIRSNLTKKKNKLRFQSTSKKKVENPMPIGEKRDFLKAQIKADEKLLNEIQTKLDGFSKTK